MPQSHHALPQLVPQRAANALSRMRAALWIEKPSLDVEGAAAMDSFQGVAEAEGLAYGPVRAGETFGPSGGGWAQRWFRVRIPAAEPGEAGRRVLFWQCQGETTAYIDGKPWAGLDMAHAYCPIPDGAHEILLDCGTYQTAIWYPGPPISALTGARFDRAFVAVRNPGIWDAFYDFEALVLLMRHLMERGGIVSAGSQGYNPPWDSASPLLRRLLFRLNQACDSYDRGDMEALRRGLDESYREFPAGPLQGKVSLVGHAHIDLVWLWPEAVTYRKAVHTFATTLRLMERYPEFRFSQSSPALYRAVARRSPDLSRAVGERIREGSWEATGGAEVEPDVNLPSGEALARSLLHGQRGFQDIQGRRSECLWLPDVFGYPACLPQILAQSGVKFFFTTKLTWSAVTRFPHSTFRWRGPDGKSVLVHLSAVGFNDLVEPRSLTEAVFRSRQTGVTEEVLLAMGYGDGGGGATEEMMERARRYGNLAGVPRASWSTAEDFFRRLDSHGAEFPEYEGELYLEYHRGTYTTQSEFKRLYRAAERSLLELEAALALYGKGPLPAPRWQRALFAQFHDAIPGSSIGLVYKELEPDLLAVVDGEGKALADLLAADGGKHAGVFNPLAIARTAVVDVAAGPHLDALRGMGAALQEAGEGFLAQIAVPGFGTWPLGAADGGHASCTTAAEAARAAWEVSDGVLDNGRLRVRFDAQGRIESMSEGGRPVAGRGRFVLYPDYPANYDAWDIDRHTLELGEDVAGPGPLRVAESGPLRAALEGSSALGAGSRLSVRYILEEGSARLLLEVRVDWREEHRLLKFVVDSACGGRFARHGAPYGSVMRDRVPGMEREEAQWEVPAQRWMAAVDDSCSRGLALITEAKYGFSVRDREVGLSLLRSPTSPDPLADRGSHGIRFAVGGYVPAAQGAAAPGAARLSTPAEAEALYAGLPLCGTGGQARAPFRLGPLGSLVPSSVKPLEDGKGYLVRFHETAGMEGAVEIAFDGSPARVSLGNLLEDRIGELPEAAPGRYRVEYGRYAVVTVLVEV